MTVQPIDASSAALFLTTADLARRGLTPESLTLRRALELTQLAFQRLGLRCTGELEIEAYPSRDGVLVFARALPPRRRRNTRSHSAHRRLRRTSPPWFFY